MHAVTDKTLEQNVREWLETEGYPLEIKVAREFRDRGFRVQQSEYYKNREGVFRETDVLAARSTLWDDPQMTTLFEMEAVVECKGFPSRPWVIFSAPLAKNTPAHQRDVRIGTPRGIQLMSIALMGSELAELEYFKPRERAAYSVVPAFKGNDDAFKAVSGIADAAYARAVHWGEQDLEDVVDLFGVYFPVVVINAPLFECFEDAGGLQLVERTHVPLHWRKTFFQEHEFTVIDIVTEQGLTTYVQHMVEVYDVLDRVYGDPKTREERSLGYSPRIQE